MGRSITAAGPGAHRVPGRVVGRVLGAALAAGLLTACDPDGGLVRQDDKTEPVEVEETFTQAPRPKVDVLWVVDATPSMAGELDALADAFDRFAEALDAQDLAWQAGVVTADPDDAVLLGNPWVVHPDLDDPAAAFGDAVAVDLDATAAEAGLAAAVAAVEDPDGLNRGFRRPDAALHVVVLSDADDDSDAWLGDDPVGAFGDFLLAEEERTGLDAQLSVVVGPTPAGCAGAAPAERYTAAAEASGGLVASICDPDLAAVAEEIGEASISLPDTFELQARAEVDSVVVRVDGARTEAWTLREDGLAVIMDSPPPAGAEVRIRYRVAEEDG